MPPKRRHLSIYRVKLYFHPTRGAPDQISRLDGGKMGPPAPVFHPPPRTSKSICDFDISNWRFDLAAPHLLVAFSCNGGRFRKRNLKHAKECSIQQRRGFACGVCRWKRRFGCSRNSAVSAARFESGFRERDGQGQHWRGPHSHGGFLKMIVCESGGHANGLTCFIFRFLRRPQDGSQPPSGWARPWPWQTRPGRTSTLLAVLPYQITLLNNQIYKMMLAR